MKKVLLLSLFILSGLFVNAQAHKDYFDGNVRFYIAPGIRTLVHDDMNLDFKIKDESLDPDSLLHSKKMNKSQYLYDLLWGINFDLSDRYFLKFQMGNGFNQFRSFYGDLGFGWNIKFDRWLIQPGIDIGLSGNRTGMGTLKRSLDTSSHYMTFKSKDFSDKQLNPIYSHLCGNLKPTIMFNYGLTPHISLFGDIGYNYTFASRERIVMNGNDYTNSSNSIRVALPLSSPDMVLKNNNIQTTHLGLNPNGLFVHFGIVFHFGGSSGSSSTTSTPYSTPTYTTPTPSQPREYTPRPKSTPSTPRPAPTPSMPRPRETPRPSTPKPPVRN